MLALVRSFLASREQDNKITVGELKAFAERTGIDIQLRPKQPQIPVSVPAGAEK